MSKHGIDLLKRRLGDKISDLQSDAETVRARLENEEHVQTNLKRCEEKLNTKLEKSFTQLYKMLEQYKKELNGKVNTLFCHHRRVIMKQNGALHECLASVNKVLKPYHLTNFVNTCYINSRRTLFDMIPFSPYCNAGDKIVYRP